MNSQTVTGISTQLSRRLYDSGMEKRSGLGASSPRVAKWLGDIREFFPAPVVQKLPKRMHSSG
jgi:hypothetical protein